MSNDTFSPFGANTGYLAELYQNYLVDPSSVEPEWADLFRSMDQEALASITRGYSNGHTNGHAHGVAKAAGGGSVREGASSGRAVAEKLLAAFRTYGHQAAQLSPLVAGGMKAQEPVELTLRYLGEQSDASTITMQGVSVGGLEFTNAATLIEKLRSVYCGTVGFEFSHLTRVEEREWLQERIESRPVALYSAQERREILRDLIRADLFESELHKKYVGTKRFSLEGNDTLIPLVSQVYRAAGKAGLKGVVCGMAHRGRLNVLANNFGKPLSTIFSEFEDTTLATIAGAGDVKYHLGFEASVTPNGVALDISLLPNPSHLEFVNPVVEGVARALQDSFDRSDRSKYLPIAMHGDAAFAGQGIVFETINFSGVSGYATGGTLHVVINNQIGFTTTPEESRSTRYCTDLAKGIDCPVFHVNAEDPESACWVAQLAVEYRNEFGKDVIVDLIGHRKHGHNEGDDPSFTQPTTYAEVKGKRPIWQSYGERLVEGGVVGQSDIEGEVAEYKALFAAAQSGVGAGLGKDACAIHGKLILEPKETGVEAGVLKKVARALISFPEHFKAHPKLSKIIEKRVETVEDGHGIEWGVAEALAFGSLLLEGRSVRLSGQDCGRGTFSHRHLILDDYEGGAPFSPLAELAKNEGAEGFFEVHNSPLSEAAVLGFEFGYAATKRDTLTMWEAQFGDFSNGAQVIIDQFITSSESKWAQLSGVVMMLPHGYEGQGPEHSSARLERYLQMCAENNMRVCYPSTAAQHFHMLRRQGLAEIRRPLVVMTPKSLLRLPAAMSALSDMTSGAFQSIIHTTVGAPKKGAPVVFMCGKVYHDLNAALQDSGVSAHLVRVEDLYPFPAEQIRAMIKETGAKAAYWIQEEPQNMGAWSHVEPHLRAVIGVSPIYVGRPASAATATGSHKRHGIEQKAILAEMVKHLGGK